MSYQKFDSEKSSSNSHGKFDSLKLDEIYVTKPTTINVYGGVKIHIDDNNEITVEGHSKLKFTTDSDIEFDGKNINLQAQENVLVLVNISLSRHQGLILTQNMIKVDIRNNAICST